MQAHPAWTLPGPLQQARRNSGVLPGFGLTAGFTALYLSIVVVVPLLALFSGPAAFSVAQLQAAAVSPRVLAAFGLSVGAALAAAAINTLFGLVVAWVLVRCPFPGRQVVDALVDLPFALPTAVGGIALTAIWSQNGSLGRHFAAHGVKVAFTPLGVVVALIFVGLPFVVRMVQPVLQELDAAQEEAACSLGATRLQIIRRVVLPQVLPAAVGGGMLAFARGLGEYGTVVFISGNMPHRTETVPFLILARLEQYDYGGATAVAVLMLALAVALLASVHLLQARAARGRAGGGGRR
jgi:sulfate transport system permease protein